MKEERSRGLLVITVAAQGLDELRLGVQHRHGADPVLGHVVEPPQNLPGESDVGGIDLQVKVAGWLRPGPGDDLVFLQPQRRPPVGLLPEVLEPEPGEFAGVPSACR